MTKCNFVVCQSIQKFVDSPPYVTPVLLVDADTLDRLVAEDNGEAETGGLNESCRQTFGEHM